MSTEYRLSYTANEIDEKLGMIDQLSEEITIVDDKIFIGEENPPENAEVWFNPNGIIVGDDLPTASEATKGCVKVGSGLQIASDGTLSVTGGGNTASVYELIETITLEEETKQIIRTTEPSGAQYDFKALILSLITGDKAINAGHVTVACYGNNITLCSYGVANAIANGAKRHVTCVVDLMKGICDTRITSAGYLDVSMTQLYQQPKVLIVDGTSRIDDVRITATSDGILLPIGTTVKIWGVRR